VAIVDTHCHLFLMEGDPGAMVREARASELEALICVGIDAASSLRSSELADSLPGVFATAGMHPHSAADFDEKAGATVEQLLSDPRVVAVGETGLDHFRMLSPAEVQERVFRDHCSLARVSGKPLVVHTRDAWPDVLRVLREERADRVVLHCFSGGEAEAREAASRGYYCSFAGPVTYPKNDDLRAAAAAVPLDLLLVETDSPFLPPQAVRGEANRPGNLSHVVTALSEARGADRDGLAEATTRNARAAFDLPD
jgi:TatD DNase family protein